MLTVLPAVVVVDAPGTVVVEAPGTVVDPPADVVVELAPLPVGAVVLLFAVLGRREGPGAAVVVGAPVDVAAEATVDPLTAVVLAVVVAVWPEPVAATDDVVVEGLVFVGSEVTHRVPY